MAIFYYLPPKDKKRDCTFRWGTNTSFILLQEIIFKLHVVLSLFKQRPRVTHEWTRKQVPKFGREKHQDRAQLLLYRLIQSGQIRKFC